MLISCDSNFIGAIIRRPTWPDLTEYFGVMQLNNMVPGEAVFSYRRLFWLCQLYVLSLSVDFTKCCNPIISSRLTVSTLNPVILASLLSCQAWGWDRNDIPKCRILPTILWCVITQKSYTISFIMAKALEHTNKLVLQLSASLNKIKITLLKVWNAQRGFAVQISSRSLHLSLVWHEDA